MPEATQQSLSWKETRRTGMVDVERDKDTERQRERKHPATDSERDRSRDMEKETDNTGWVFALFLPLAAPSESPK